MKKTRTERLLAAALLGSVIGATGCSASTAQSEPTTPEAAEGEKSSCKGQHGCSGEGTPGESAGGENTDGENTGEKHTCSKGTPGMPSGFGGGL